MKAIKGHLETAEASEEFKAALADLESALISCDTGILVATKPKDEALRDMVASISELGNASKEMATAAKNAPEELPTALKNTANAMTKAVNNATALAATMDTKSSQKALLNGLKGVANEMKGLMGVSKAVAVNPDDPNLNKLLLSNGKNVADALMRLAEAAKGAAVQAAKKEKANLNDLEAEAAAEKELVNAGKAIDGFIGQLADATQSSRQRAQERGISEDEQNITEAILEAANAIAKATGALVTQATAVQQEFQKLLRDPQTSQHYKRDPQFAQGLIAAARTVAKAVQNLVKVANDAADGNASEEALVVAAQAVSAATTKLAGASQNKYNPDSEAQRRLREAADRVNGATSQLMGAAKMAADWQKEQESQGEDEKYQLGENKLAEMAKQMEILKLEKELERAKQRLQKEKGGAPQQQQKPGPAPGRGRGVAWNNNAARGVPPPSARGPPPGQQQPMRQGPPR
jgi:talin